MMLEHTHVPTSEVQAFVDLANKRFEPLNCRIEIVGLAPDVRLRVFAPWLKKWVDLALHCDYFTRGDRRREWDTLIRTRLLDTLTPELPLLENVFREYNRLHETLAHQQAQIAMLHGLVAGILVEMEMR